MVAALDHCGQGLDRLVGRGDGADIERIEVADELAAGIVLVDRHLGTGDAGVGWLDIDARGGPRVLADLVDIADGERGERRRLRELDGDTARLVGAGGVPRARLKASRNAGQQRRNQQGRCVPENSASLRAWQLHGDGTKGAKRRAGYRSAGVVLW